MLVSLGCIVEGDGEKRAAPKLLARIAENLAPQVQLRFPEPFRAGRNKLVKPGEIERTIELVVRRLTAPRGVFILLDADDDCPANLGPELLARAARARPDVPFALVLANREYEAWFLAAIESLAGHCELPTELPPFPDPESIRGAKERISRLMRRGRRYSPTADQSELTLRFDMELARQRSPSFDKCWREVDRLLSTICPKSAEDSAEPQ
jgi:hypothetical protein